MTHMENKIDNAVIGTENVIPEVKKAVVDEKISTPTMDVTKDNAVKVTEKVDSGAKKVGDSIKEHGAELKKDILGVGSKIKDTLTK